MTRPPLTFALLSALAAAVLAAGPIACGGGGGTDGGKTADLATAPMPDLTVVSTDMAERLGCRGLLFCLQACKGDGPCQNTCLGRASASATTKFQALADCTMTVCKMPAGPTDGGTADGGTPYCASDQDKSARCQDCLANAAQSKACSTPFGECFAEP